MNDTHQTVTTGTQVNWLWVFAMLLVFLFSNQVHACSCTPSGPPCQSFWQTDAVFLGTVRAKTVVTAEVDNETKRTAQQMSVRFLVEDVYRGLLGGNDVEIITGIGAADCGYNFEKGKRYLVYANEYQNKLRTSICTRTSLLTDARKDLSYFQNLPPEGSGASIVVRVLQRSGNQETTPMKGVKVTLEGADNLFEGKTDVAGRYEFRHLPPGKYKVKSAIPETPRNHWQTEATVDDRACIEVEFSNNVEVLPSGLF